MAKVNQVPGKLSFNQAIRDFFRGYLDFSGRTSRAGLNYSLLFLAFFVFPLVFLYHLIESILTRGILLPDNELFNPFFYLILICFVVFILPGTASMIRRMNDIGFSFGWKLFMFLVLVATIVLTAYAYENPQTWLCFSLFMGLVFLAVLVLFLALLPSHYFDEV